MGRKSFSAVDRQPERHPAGELLLLAVGQRMEARALDVPEAPLEPVVAIEPGASGKLERKLDVSAFGGTVTAISTYRRKSDASRVVVEVEPKGDALGVVSREGNTLVLTFADGAAHPMLSGVGADGSAAGGDVVLRR